MIRSLLPETMTSSMDEQPVAGFVTVRTKVPGVLTTGLVVVFAFTPGPLQLSVNPGVGAVAGPMLTVGSRQLMVWSVPASATGLG